MRAYQLENGKYVIATFLPTKNCFRTTITRTKNIAEASNVNNLKDAVQYCSIDSVSRALRKRKSKKAK